MSLATNTMIGIGLIFGLSLVLSYLTYQDLPSFLCYALFVSGFVVWAELLDFWIIILILIILIILVVYNKKSDG